MCRICERARAGELTAEQALAEMGRSGQDPQHFDRLLDELLGTTDPTSDPDLDEAWERWRRGG